LQFLHHPTPDVSLATLEDLIARIEKRSSGAKESASPRKEKVAPTT